MRPEAREGGPRAPGVAIPALPDAPDLAPVDTAGLRRALGNFPTGVTVVTTRAADGTRVGVTANSFTSVSMEPPLVLWSLSRRSASLAAFERCRHFAINVLAGHQAGVCRQFASACADRFAGVVLRDGVDAIPLIEDAVARFECRAVAAYPGGDHVILVGEVVRYDAAPSDALLFCRGVLQPCPPPAPPAPGPAPSCLSAAA